MTKVTYEQAQAVRRVAQAMAELSEIWDEDFNTAYEELGEDVTRDLLTRSFDEMTSEWFGFAHEVKERADND
jgi:hypothetical protein